MNIVLINHYAGSLLHGMEYRPYYLAREWVRRGHRVVVIAASFSHVRSLQPEMTGSIREDLIGGIEYLWLKTRHYRGNGLDRMVNMIAFLRRLWRLRWYLQKNCKPDVVIASSTYPLDIYPARRMARKSGAKLIFEVHDLWPLSPIELGGMPRWHPFIMIMQFAENYAYRNADAVVSILPTAKEYMIEHGMRPDKFVHIPNGIETAGWDGKPAPLPDEHARVFSKLRAEKRFVVCYAGAHGLANALDVLLDAAMELRNRPVSIVLIGKGPEKEKLEERAARNGLVHVHFLDPVHRNAVPSALAAADALYIGLQRRPLFRFGVSPNKLNDYMMAAKPIVSAITAGNDMVTESGCGISVPAEDPSAISAAVLTLLAMTRRERAAMGLRGREYVLRNNAYDILADRFERVMTSCRMQESAAGRRPT